MLRTGFIASWLLIALASSAAAQSAQNVLVVINEASADSREVGEYYMQKRQVPADNVVRLQLPTTDDMDRATFQAKVETPLMAWFTTHTAWDRILYIVLTKGVPLRVTGTGGQAGTIASVDSELTLLYRKMTGIPVLLNGPLRNPYYVEGLPAGGVRPFTHEKHDIFLVTRLDGFTVSQAKALVDRGLAPSRDGEIVLDGRVEIGRETPGNAWLERAAASLQKISGWSNRVTLDTSGKRAGRGEKLFGYYSWGSNDLIVQAAGAPELAFAPGALAAMFVSSDARTFRAPPEGWRPGTKTEFAGTNQSLTGELVRQGVTGAAGHVSEPFLIAAIRPDVLFPSYVSGLNLAEAFYAAMPYVSWQTVVLGDPLCAPFRQKALDRTQIETAVDPITELPGHFTQHRLATPTRGDIKVDAFKHFIRADYLNGRGDQARAREALERAVAMDDRFVAAHVALAGLAQVRSDWDGAIASFRRALVHSPNNIAALNDLAYILAERKQEPADALPLAIKAFQLSKGLPVVADTYAWVQHLLGRSKEAAPIIRQAAKQLPRNAEVQWHTAAILAAIGETAAARSALDTALKLDADLGNRADVKALRSKLQTPSK